MSALYFVAAVLCCAEAYVFSRTATAPRITSGALTSRMAPVVLSEEPANLSLPVLATIGGGALGIFGAAYCTSTGSPPTGLAIAVATLIAVTVGAGEDQVVEVIRCIAKYYLADRSQVVRGCLVVQVQPQERGALGRRLLGLAQLVN